MKQKRNEASREEEGRETEAVTESLSSEMGKDTVALPDAQRRRRRAQDVREPPSREGGLRPADSARPTRNRPLGTEHLERAVMSLLWAARRFRSRVLLRRRKRLIPGLSLPRSFKTLTKVQTHSNDRRQLCRSLETTDVLIRVAR